MARVKVVIPHNNCLPDCPSRMKSTFEKRNNVQKNLQRISNKLNYPVSSYAYITNYKRELSPQQFGPLAMMVPKLIPPKTNEIKIQCFHFSLIHTKADCLKVSQNTLILYIVILFSTTATVSRHWTLLFANTYFKPHTSLFGAGKKKVVCHFNSSLPFQKRRSREGG